jgi:hypothetical protein
MQMGTQGVQLKWVLPWLVCWAHCAGTKENFVQSWLRLSQHITQYFIPHLTVRYFSSFVPIGQQAGQATVPGRLSLNLGLWGQQWGQH